MTQSCKTYIVCTRQELPCVRPDKLFDYTNKTFKTSGVMDSICQQICDNLKAQYKHNMPMLSCLNSLYLEKSLSNHDFIGSVPSQLHKEKLDEILPLLKKEILSRNYSADSFEIRVKKPSFFPLPSPTSALDLKKTDASPPQAFFEKTKNLPFMPGSVFDKAHTFKSFISGPSNSLAYAATLNVAAKPLSNLYNPLFIHGKSGFGKTHLLHALGQTLLKKKPELKVRYLTAERFLHSCVSSIRNKSMEEFQRKYRYNTDVLLIDDIQSIERGDVSQEEFFHTFNAITDRGGLVVCTCDCLPNSLKRLQARLKTRLVSGLVVKIDPADKETCINILKIKSKDRKINLNEDIFSYLAERPCSSVRELVGNLNKIKMQAELKGIPISLGFVRSIFEESSLHLSHCFSSPEEIIESVAQEHQVSVDQFTGQRKRLSKRLIEIRNKAIHLSRKNFPYITTKQLALLFNLSSKTILKVIK